MVMLLQVFFIVLVAHIAAANSPSRCGADEPACPANEHYVNNSSQCTKTCGNRSTVNSATAGACVSYTGCICDEGYVKQYDNATGPCIPENKCPPIPTNCPEYEEPSSCAFVCPPQTCESIYTSYDCPKKECEPGCNCINNYLRKNGVCIPSEKCSEDTTTNEEPTSCKRSCPPKTCESLVALYRRPKEECQPGCDCVKNYLRNKTGVCFNSRDCFKNDTPQPPKCGENEIATDCARVCPPQSCDSQYLNYLCAIGNCTAGCNCMDGFLRNADNICIPSSLCPPSPYMPIPIDGPFTPIKPHRLPVRRCKDRNAVFKKCPSPCALTCGQPKPRPCSAACLKGGCECKPGFVLDKVGGKCIRLEQCNGGNPTCPGNMTYVHCKMGCPTNYCPKNDRQARVICDPPRPCPSGCVCKSGYLMLSETDDKCIDSSECPPFKCTRPNEEWNPRPPSCRAERCEDLGQDLAMCVHSYPYGPPTCLCKPGFYRNQSNVCVTASECPCKGDPNAVMSNCPTPCPATCKDPSTNKICTKNCLEPGCVCLSGFVLDEASGKCVRASECPAVPGQCKDPNASWSECTSACPPTCSDRYKPRACILKCMPPGCQCNRGYYLDDQGKCVLPEQCPTCNGDYNATASDCPSPCPATCADPDRSNKGCIASCAEGGCACKSGFILTEVGGKCIAPEDCPGGSPTCPANETYAECKFGCPTNYCPVDDTRAVPSCSLPYPCPSGCVCQGGNLRRNDNEQCVAPTDCPPVTCTRPNEEFNSNPPNCLADRCEDRYGNSTDCSVFWPNGRPACVCKKGFYRNSNDTCVPESECSCKGDPNAVMSNCPTPCPATCKDPSTNKICTRNCLEPGCVCISGFVLDEASGKCVPASECPGGNPTCPGNETYVPCRIECPTEYCPKDDSQAIVVCDPPQICPSGCICKAGYLMLSKTDDKCIDSSECPPFQCTRPNEEYNPRPPSCRAERCEDLGQDLATCVRSYPYDPPTCLCKPGFYRNQSNVCVTASECLQCEQKNAVYSECPSACQATCADPDIIRECMQICKSPNCVCKKGYVLDEDSGSCVLRKNCPAVPGQCKDPNASWSECTSACPPTCSRRYKPSFCILMCMPPGCQCNPGYYLDDQGKCVLPEQCPTCNGDYNATASDCPSPCPATCADPDRNNKACIASCAEGGCACKSGFIRTEVGGKCIIPEDCPGGSPTCPANETYAECKFGCPTNYCPVDDTRAVPLCSPQYPCPSGCVCQGGNLRRNDNEQCVAPTDCPPVTCTRPNEEFNSNPPNCLADRCEDRYGNSTDCPVFWPNGRPACVCKKGFYRNSNDTCVPESECSCKGDPNAVMSNCPTPCPATCKDPSTNKICTRNCLEPGCVCISGFVLDEASGKCVRASECPAVPGQCKDPNASWSECTTACPPTCNNRYKPMFCIEMCMAPGCQCNPGYYLDDQGKCVLPEQCPTCNGDYNATASDCPSPCPATCADPDRSNKGCIASCAEGGCACKSGFIRTEVGGKCIIPEDCPGGSPTCPANETYAQCKIGCPTNYCPVDDTRAVPLCSPQYPCPPGCVCQGGNLRRKDNEQCVPATDCPPVTCTRPNEEFNSNPPKCLADRCEDRYGNSTDCPVFWPNGRPACVCKKGFYRNSNDTCVPESECPTICNVPVECRRTCASPNPPNCPYNPPQSNKDGCDCQEGYILSDINGKCIPIQECPSDQGCNGDPHARPKRCPYPCPGTCDAPEAAPCKKLCEPIGCECEQGYIFNKDGKCILPDDCPGGNPCGKNGYYAFCRFGCGQDYCPTDDNRGIILCKPPRDCLPGCRCKINYRWINYENRTCIESASCPPVECTRQNEVWDGCPSDCLAERCEDVNNPYTACDNVLLNCQPKCVCKKGYFRNKDDLCIPANECSQKCTVPAECRRTCANPNPANCPYSPLTTNIDGCGCQEGYILSEEGGKCIKYEECPTCKGDQNAEVRKCPTACPSTCSSPNAQLCEKKCEEIGCGCKLGFILSEVNGKCIEPDSCPGGNPCGPNSNFAYCKYSCPSDYCPTSDSRGIIACDPIPFCLSGCTCKFNHKRLSYKNETCVPSSSCPRLKCTRPNEVWNKCPSACLAEGCESANNQPSVCNTLLPVSCEPRCVCRKNHFRNESDICVPAKNCPRKPDPKEC